MFDFPNFSCSSGNGKLQGSGVGLELLCCGVELSLNLGVVVAKIVQVLECVYGSILYELVEVCGKRFHPVTEGIGAVRSLITADEMNRALVEPISEGYLHLGQLLESLNLVDSVQEELVSADLRQLSHLFLVDHVHLIADFIKSC